MEATTGQFISFRLQTAIEGGGGMMRSYRAILSTTTPLMGTQIQPREAPSGVEQKLGRFGSNAAKPPF